MNDKQGMDEVAEAAFRNHYRDVLTFLERRIDNREDAEDLAQAVFTDALKGLSPSGGSGDAPILPWLYTVARRRLVDHLRRRRRSTMLLKARLSPTSREPSYGVNVAEALGRAIGTLPPETKRIVVLRLLEGQTFATIAQHVGVSEGACKMRFARALRAIRDELREEGIES